MRNRALKTGILLLALLAATFAVADDYKIDPVHSNAVFAVKHMKVSTVKGRFTDVSGTIHYDPADLTKSSVSAIIKTASVSTDNERRDNHLKSDAFFDIAKYPEMKFESTRVEKRGDQLVAIGNLTIKDVTRQVELPFTVDSAEVGGKKRIGVEASLPINRFDYHVSWDDPTHSVVGPNVKIELSIEAVQAQPAPATAAK